MSDIDKAYESRQHTDRYDNMLDCLIGHREGRGTRHASVPSDVICSTTQHTPTPTWTKEPPKTGGWYNYRKGSVVGRYFLRACGIMNPMMPDHMMMAYEEEDGRNGKNIICNVNEEFMDCEWFGPLSEEPEKLWGA